MARFDDSIVPRTPSEAVTGLLRRDELVLVEPGADVVALLGTLESDFALVARRVETGAHDVEAARPVLIGKMENFAVDDAVVCLDHQPIGFGQIGDVNPGPPLFAIAAKDRDRPPPPSRTSPR